MTDFSSFVHDAHQRAGKFSRYGQEQALTYACEDVVENECGTRKFKSRDINQWVDQICQREDLDTPHIEILRKSTSTLASAHAEDHSICIRGARTTASTVLHELAHLSCGVSGHGVLFRDELVRLSRAHISVDYAAMLHGLFVATGLEMSPWPASAARR